MLWTNVLRSGPLCPFEILPLIRNLSLFVCLMSANQAAKSMIWKELEISLFIRRHLLSVKTDDKEQKKVSKLVRNKLLHSVTLYWKGLTSRWWALYIPLHPPDNVIDFCRVGECAVGYWPRSRLVHLLPISRSLSWITQECGIIYPAAVGAVFQFQQHEITSPFFRTSNNWWIQFCS